MGRRLIIISGAGLSVDSGVRAFRTDTESGKSLWDEYDLEEVCEIRAFDRGYSAFLGETVPYSRDKYGVDFYTKTHEFYNLRRQELEDIEPNLAHLRIAEWYGRYTGQVVNLTTNVDDLLERAGVPKYDITHIHGYLPEVFIAQGDTKYDDVELLDIGHANLEFAEYTWAKPNVVFFGEVAPEYPALFNTLDGITANDMVILVGCSNVVINFISELLPKARRGTKVLIVNPDIRYDEQQWLTDAGIVQFRAGAAEVFGNKHFINLVENFMEGKIHV